MPMAAMDKQQEKGGKRAKRKIPYGEQHERNFLLIQHQPAKCKQ